MSKHKDQYAVLGVLPDAEQEVVKAIYLALAKKYNPENSASTGSAEKMKKINSAYDVLSDPAQRKAYDITRSKEKETTGDYEPDVDDGELSVYGHNDEWEFAVEHYPNLASLQKQVASISPTLSIAFQTTVLSSKEFIKSSAVMDQLISSFLKRYFGNSEVIQGFARELLIDKKLAAAKELNKAVRILGDSIQDRKLIQKIGDKYGIDLGLNSYGGVGQSITTVIRKLTDLGYKIDDEGYEGCTVTNLNGVRLPFKFNDETLRKLLEESSAKPKAKQVSNNAQPATFKSKSRRGTVKKSSHISDSAVERDPPSIWTPITLAVIAYIGALLYQADWDPGYAFYRYSQNPSWAITALGAIFPLFLGLIHLGISQLSVSKRNSYSRRRIMIGWSIVSIAVILMAFFGFAKHS